MRKRRDASGREAGPRPVHSKSSVRNDYSSFTLRMAGVGQRREKRKKRSFGKKI